MASLWGSRRGQSWVETVFTPLLHLILVAAILFLAMYRINVVTSSKSFDETYQARDIALLIDTVLTSPGEVYFDYTKYQPESAITVHENSVGVSSASQLATYQPHTAFFVPHPHLNVEQKIVNEPFHLEKTDAVRLVAGRAVVKQPICDAMFIPQSSLIIIDPLYDPDGLALKLAQAIKAYAFMLPKSVIQLTTSTHEELNEAEHLRRIPSNAQLVLRLKHISQPTVKALVNNKKQSYDLACHIQQQLGQQKDIHMTQTIDAPVVISLELPITSPALLAQQLITTLKLHTQENTP